MLITGHMEDLDYSQPGDMLIISQFQSTDAASDDLHAGCREISEDKSAAGELEYIE